MNVSLFTHCETCALFCPRIQPPWIRAHPWPNNHSFDCLTPAMSVMVVRLTHTLSLTILHTGTITVAYGVNQERQETACTLSTLRMFSSGPPFHCKIALLGFRFPESEYMRLDGARPTISAYTSTAPAQISNSAINLLLLTNVPHIPTVPRI